VRIVALQYEIDVAIQLCTGLIQRFFQPCGVVNFDCGGGSGKRLQRADKIT
jgi:hypothetical protein